MFRNYFKTAWRNIYKNKLFSFINILGLSIGIATCFVIMLYVQDELSYDKFNVNANNIVRILFVGNINGGKINESVVMPPVAEAMKIDFPQVLDATRIHENSSKIIYKDKVFNDNLFANVDANFFSIFTLSMIKGDAKTALLQPNTVVMTQSTAKKYFGSEDPIGKTIIKTADDNTPYTVTGIIKDMPANSHFHFDILGSMKNIERAYEDAWTKGGFHTYLLLKPGTDIKQMEREFPIMVKKYMGPAIQQAMGLSLNDFITKGNSLGFALQPLTSIHLNSNTTTEFEPGGNATYVYIFAGIAFFMLIVACINFINLSTAGASKRAKEIGIRKVAGSARFQLISQFLSESILLSFFALITAFALAQLALPAFNNIAGRQLSFDVTSFLSFIGLGLLVGVIAGIYPAFYLSSFKPTAVLKGKLTTNHKSFGLRSCLVVFQFFISVALIISTIVVYQQMKFIQSKDLGYNKEQLITITNSYVLGKNENAFKQQILQDPRILNATTSYYKPAEPYKYNNALAYPQGNDNNVVNGVDYHVDENYIPTLGMHIISGRNFSKDFPTDSTAIILNETAATALGWNNETAIGKTVIRQNSDKGKNFLFHVIGVVKNFNFKSLHEAISPLYMSLQPESGLIFKIKTTDVAGLLATMKKQWDSYNTGEPFTYN
ncbi:MAG: ABC transporter permease, partial [Panacibacter sp.]